MLMIHLKMEVDGQNQTKILYKRGYKKTTKKEKERKRENVRNVKIAHTSAFSLRKLVDSPHMDFVLYLEPCKIY